MADNISIISTIKNPGDLKLNALVSQYDWPDLSGLKSNGCTWNNCICSSKEFLIKNECSGVLACR